METPEEKKFNDKLFESLNKRYGLKGRIVVASESGLRKIEIIKYEPLALPIGKLDFTKFIGKSLIPEPKWKIILNKILKSFGFYISDRYLANNVHRYFIRRFKKYPTDFSKRLTKI